MSIIDAPALTAPATDLPSPETPALDYFAVGRDVWVPARGRRTRIVAPLSDSRADGSVFTKLGYVYGAIPLPMPGEALRGGLYFVGWAYPGEDDNLTGLTTGGTELTRVTKDSAALWDARDVLDATDTTVLGLRDALALLCEGDARVASLKELRGDESARLLSAGTSARLAAEAAAKQRLDALVSRAHEWADLHDLCDKFDEFCSDNNLPEREREYEVTVHVTLSVPVSLTVKSRDEVVDTFNDNYDEDDIWRMIRDQDIDPSDVMAYDVEVRDYNRV